MRRQAISPEAHKRSALLRAAVQHGEIALDVYDREGRPIATIDGGRPIFKKAPA